MASSLCMYVCVWYAYNLVDINGRVEEEPARERTAYILCTVALTNSDTLLKLRLVVMLGNPTNKCKNIYIYILFIHPH